ncbi:hypothetical protein BC826DRAFT_982481 [Russula brevipes]|nr:hypothetical protein BC826DRAFT_982481 [Russula brevipes]
MQLDPARAHVLYLEPNLRSPDGHGRNHGSVGPHHVHMDPSVGACGHLPSPCLCTSFYFSFSGALTLIPLNCR